jgi:uncharacterized protein
VALSFFFKLYSVAMFAVLLFTVVLFRQGTDSAQSAQAPTLSQSKISTEDLTKLRVKAEAGDAAAQFSLGRAYEDGNGTPQNDAQAAAWYRKAADQGNASAQNSLGLMYREGLGVPRDQQEAVQWYHKAARQKNAAAMFNLGTAYYNGDGVGVDYRLAYAWFLLAQEQSSVNAVSAISRTGKELMAGEQIEAWFAIASMYQKGVDLEQNDHEAIKWLTKAADGGSAQAKVQMAGMYANGQGVPKDFARVLELCQSAAKQGSGPGHYCVGIVYRQGLGVPKSPQIALKSFRNAAELNHRGAIMTLVEMYEKGEGTEVNRSEAFYWLYRAHGEGVVDAKQRAAELRKQMQADDIKHVEKKLRGQHFDPKAVFKEMELPPS